MVPAIVVSVVVATTSTSVPSVVTTIVVKLTITIAGLPVEIRSATAAMVVVIITIAIITKLLIFR